VWVARPGRLADGKVDMLTVVLQLGVRRLWSESDLPRLTING
jgi:hypothetical protein